MYFLCVESSDIHSALVLSPFYIGNYICCIFLHRVLSNVDDFKAILVIWLFNFNSMFIHFKYLFLFLTGRLDVVCVGFVRWIVIILSVFKITNLKNFSFYLFRKRGIVLPASTEEELRKGAVATEPGTLTTFLARFRFWLPAYV